MVHRLCAAGRCEHRHGDFIKEFNVSDLQTSTVRVRPAACDKVKWIDKPEGNAIDFYYMLA